MRHALPLAAMILALGLVLAHESAVSEEAPPAEPAKDKFTTVAVADAHKEEEYKPPPGFHKKKRGKIVLYCMQDSTVGTRFKTEKCYDETQMHDYLLSQEQNNRDFDQRRAICSNPAICRIE
jgi:hypothetical protein